MMKWHATARPDGRWWYVEIDGLDAGYGQARRLAEVPTAAREIISVNTGGKPDDIDVDVIIKVPGGLQMLLDDANRKDAEARDTAKSAAALRREAARSLVDGGLSQKDASQVLGVTPQRLNQLIKS
jgi:hypothetical protein